MAINKVTTDFLSTVKARSKDAMSWFRDIVKKTKNVIPARRGRKELTGDRNVGAVLTPEIGKMYLFNYDAKYKDILPYWDRWPLIFPFDETDNGFYGINLHYLPVDKRINLMTALIKAQGEAGANLDDNYVLGLSYTIIKGFKPARKCIKRYINEGTYRKSPFYTISGQDWSYAAALPLQKFVGPQPR